MNRLALVIGLTLTIACTGPGGSTSAAPDVPATPATPGADAPAAPATPAAPNAPAAPTAPSGDTIEVMNPLGNPMQGQKHVEPAAGTLEHTLLGALQHQSNKGNFDGFLAFIHPSKKETPKQRAELEAYAYKSSQGGIAAACLHDGALITTGRKPVNASIAGGGDTGSKVMVWCGAGRMPVPFTLYPDGDVQRITVFGLN